MVGRCCRSGTLISGRESAGGGWNEGPVTAVPKGRASATPGVVSLGDGGMNGAGGSTFVAVDVETLSWVDMRGSSWHPRG